MFATSSVMITTCQGHAMDDWQKHTMCSVLFADAVTAVALFSIAYLMQTKVLAWGKAPGHLFSTLGAFEAGVPFFLLMMHTVEES